MGGNDLKKAAKLYKTKKYSQVLQLLEAQIFRYRQNFQFFYILGMSCLQTGDYSGAASFLQRALSLRPGDEKALLGMAVVHLKQQKTSEALQDWFEVIDQNPKNKYAQKGLDIVRKTGDPDKLYAYTESRQIRKLIPADFSLSFKSIFLSLCIAVFFLLIFFFPAYRPYLPGFEISEKRVEIERLNLTVNSYIKGGAAENDAPYELSENDIKRIYNQIIDNFHRYNDNLAQRDINKLMMSNASDEIKKKLTLLESYVRVPSFDSFTTNFTYSDVQKDPPLYSNCFVIWRGKVSNLEVGNDYMRFDLLAGYETEKILEGIVPVRIAFAGKIDPVFPIEVLGQIKILDNTMELAAISIHQFINEEE